ncbi:preprotein translocase subunit SecE [Adhaeretor mobilis]|uniref:Preprotein translocase subunit SecE n=1 Tax=Adhaeretor mobilis TaxID=1930276 RepID=A0A517MTR7_9BACT|nr:preprotein translocase subunit SecE [Adhaeretor mobilis]QDS98274.1 preprotein translocase subunit SecE [Adhaeretor mobilis]
MIRITTFAILAVVVATGLFLLAHTDGSVNVLLYACLLTAWIGIYDMCDRGRFANYLGKVDEETKQLAWPNRIQLLHGVKILVSLMAILILAFGCIDTLIAYLLGI